MNQPKPRNRSFRGYPRANGLPGVRNHLAIVSLSGLEHAIARKLHARFPECVLLSTLYGRGHVGDDLRFQRQMMTALATHPNIGGAVILGPDQGLTGSVQMAVAESGRVVAGLALDQVNEDGSELLEQASHAVQLFRDDLASAERTTYPLSQLAVAIECGHSGASSGIVTNPIAGDFAVSLVQASGRALFSETLEWTGAEAVLTARAAKPEIASAILAAIGRRHKIARSAGHEIGKGNPGRQNHAGGITTLEEKSLGAVAKGGEQPILGLLPEGHPLPDEPGLYLMDTPSFSPESITSMIASGAQLVIFTTDPGNPYSSAIAPTIKITANPKAAKLKNQIDFDASAAFLGIVSRRDLLPDLAELITEIASGKITKAEIQSLGAESVSRLGPSI